MSDFKDIQDNWDIVEPQIRKARTESDIEYPEVHMTMEGKHVGKIVGRFYPEGAEGPDLVGEISKLNERIHKHEQDGMEYEKLISHLSERLNNLEKEFLRVIELYRIAGKA